MIFPSLFRAELDDGHLPLKQALNLLNLIKVVGIPIRSVQIRLLYLLTVQELGRYVELRFFDGKLIFQFFCHLDDHLIAIPRGEMDCNYVTIS